MSMLSSLRDYANGTISESALNAAINPADDDISEYEADEQFMQECMADCVPMMVQMMVMDENADSLDENVKNAVYTIQNYLVGQGYLPEAASVRINNPKVNVVHLNKQAQIKRLSTIITLKMGRKANHKAYKKYKLGQKIKKTNMEELRKVYGAKADRLAKKLYAKMQKSKKVAAVVDNAKSGKK